jgi:hypothetical protein
LVIGDDLERGYPTLEIGHWTHANSLGRGTDNARAVLPHAPADHR